MPITLRSGLAGNAIQTQAFPVGLDPTKTFFVDQNRNPCFALGEDAAEMSILLNASDIEAYLSDRASRGINLIWLYGLERIIGPSPPNNVNGDAPFIGGVDFVNPNSAYWNWVERAVQRCAVYGIAVAFNPMFFGLDDSSGYRPSVMASSDAVLQAFADYLAAKFGNCQNLIFLIGGDADPNNATGYAKLNTFATRLKAGAPNRLMTMEASRFIEVANGGGSAPNGGYSTVDAWMLALSAVPAWVDFSWVYQTLATCLSGSQRNYSLGKPCFLGEPIYELEHSITPPQLRGQAYLSVFGGCTLGHMFGNGPIWSMNAAGGGNTTPPWPSQLTSTGSLDFQRFGKLLRSRSHHLLVPDIAGSVMTVGASNGSGCARTSDGKTIFAYLPSSQTITIDMSKITDAGSLANCNWFNPQTGAVTAIGNISTTSGTHDFTSPDSNDWVLVIDSAAAGFRTPGS